MGFGNGFEFQGLVSALIIVRLSCAAEEATEKETKPPAPAAVTNLSASFQVKKGFRIELVTPGSMVSSPVAMAFDENGRLFVAEMRDYPDGRGQVPHLGRVRVLADTDGDGVFDSSTIYADDLASPSALACWDSGVFVAAAPEILYLKDASGGGVADQRKVVFTGFGTNSPASNPDAFLNNFVWGLDNRIHGGSSDLGGVITAAGVAGNPTLPLGHNDFAFDPRTLTITPEAGSAQTGLTFDNRGQKYVSSPTHPLQIAMYDPRYFARNPYVPKPPSLSSVVSPANRIFRFAGMQTPVVNLARAPATTSAVVSDAVVGALMTKARGSLIYRGNAFPSNYLENVFIADPEAHIVHRVILVQKGLEMRAQRPADELRTEFLVGRDQSFHPAQMITGPDGALYIADMQGGGESGRIFRVIPENFKSVKPPQLAKAKTFDLVTMLAHPNAWHRDTAARLLYQRHDATVVPALTNVVNSARFPQARLQALRALDGMGALNEAVLLKALRDTDERVREHGVALSERVVDHGKISDALWNRLTTLAADPSLRVRYQLVFTLGEIGRPDRVKALAEILGRDATNQWFQAAVLSSVNRGAGDLLVSLAAVPRWRNDPAGLDFLMQMALMIGMKGQMDEVAQVLNFLHGARVETQPASSLLYGLGEGLRRVGSSLASIDTQSQLQPFYDQGLQIALDTTAADSVRIAVLRLHGVSPYIASEVGNVIQALFGNGQSEAVQYAAILALSRYESSSVVSNLIARWRDLTPRMRRQGLPALLTRSDRLGSILSAVGAGQISAADFSSAQLNLLRGYPDPTISPRALQLFGPVVLARPTVIEQFKAAPRTPGSASRGRDIFRARCVACHRLGDEGQKVGPDLAAAKTYGKDKLLTAIVEPNLEISPGYITSVIETRRHELLMGIIVDENPTAITLRQPNTRDVLWPRVNIQSVQPQSWSLMPEGLEQGLSVQSMADLLEYVTMAPR